MRKIWITIVLALVAVFGIALVSYSFMDDLGYFNTASSAAGSGIVSLGKGMGGGAFLAIAKYLAEKIIAIFFIIVSILIAVMAFFVLGLVTFAF